MMKISIRLSMGIRWFSYSGAWLLCSLFLGCGPSVPYPYADVSGDVTIDNKPVPKGYVTFRPKGQGPALGAEIIAGHYLCEKVPVGEHVVTFTAESGEMRKFTDALGVPREVPVDILPPKYVNGYPTQVGKEGKMTIHFPLESR